MSGFEWFLVIVVVILVPLVIAVAVTLWSLEMARQRSKRNRGARAGGSKRRATRSMQAERGTDGPGAEREGGGGEVAT